MWLLNVSVTLVESLSFQNMYVLFIWLHSFICYKMWTFGQFYFSMWYFNQVTGIQLELLIPLTYVPEHGHNYLYTYSEDGVVIALRCNNTKHRQNRFRSLLSIVNSVYKSIFNPFPHMDAFWRFCSRRIFENIVTKEEIAQNEQFLLLTQCFPLLVIGYPFNYQDFLFFDKVCSKLSAAELLYGVKG